MERITAEFTKKVYDRDDTVDFKRRCVIQIPGEPFERIIYGADAIGYVAASILSENRPPMGTVKDLGDFHNLGLGLRRARKVY